MLNLILFIVKNQSIQTIYDYAIKNWNAISQAWTIISYFKSNFSNIYAQIATEKSKNLKEESLTGLANVLLNN